MHSLLRAFSPYAKILGPERSDGESQQASTRLPTCRQLKCAARRAPGVRRVALSADSGGDRDDDHMSAGGALGARDNADEQRFVGAEIQSSTMSSMRFPPGHPNSPPESCWRFPTAEQMPRTLHPVPSRAGGGERSYPGCATPSASPTTRVPLQNLWRLRRLSDGSSPRPGTRYSDLAILEISRTGFRWAGGGRGNRRKRPEDSVGRSRDGMGWSNGADRRRPPEGGLSRLGGEAERLPRIAGTLRSKRDGGSQPPSRNYR